MLNELPLPSSCRIEPATDPVVVPAFARRPIALPVIHPRTLDPRDPDPCRGCSDCCEYVTVNISAPRTFKDFDEIVWFLMHENIWVFIDDENDWYLQFNTRCTELRADQRCGFYPHRPRICRDYDVTDCTTYAEGDPHTHLFTAPGEFLTYVRDRHPRMHARLTKLYEAPGGNGSPAIRPNPRIRRRPRAPELRRRPRSIHT